MQKSFPIKKDNWFPALLAALSAFCVYTCMYAFRKPFTAAGFENISFLHIDYKIWLVISQTIGYTLSKFYGIRFIAEMKNEKRAETIIKLIAVSWVALLLFAIVPAPYNIIFLFINGFPLGIIYGLVFSYLEGRQTTEFLGAVLATSFIFASGFTQSVGKYLIVYFGVSQWWMPWMTGLIFFIPLVIFTWLLSKTPAPTAKDMSLRTERKQMSKQSRSHFLKSFFPGLVMLIIAYIMLTIIRDYRSNFAADIWKELGQGNDASVFTRSEIPASLIVLVLMSLLIVVKKNMDALLINHAVVIIGFLITIGITLMFNAGLVSPFWWMTVAGIGLYMGYVPFNCMLFERLIAAFKYAGNAGFIIYLADSFGYLGSDMVLIIKNFTHLTDSWTSFFVNMLLVLGFSGIILVSFSAVYFTKKYRGYFTAIPSNLKYV
jgi:MFS family permease